MFVANTIKKLRDLTRPWRRAGDKIAFVPTMGNLHAGHLSLLKKAREVGDRVVASVFVNPLQFGPFEDYDQYPRTPESDSKMMEETGVDLLYAPDVQEMYPVGKEHAATVHVPGISDILCGAYRPGHFVGVATVVNKLFNVVQPQVAIFGEKDFQQLVVIRHMTSDLLMPVEIVGAPTLREDDGLAMSSRNQYLTTAERETAPFLYRLLSSAKDKIENGEKDFRGIEQWCSHELAEAGFKPDYVSIRQAENLEQADESHKKLVILAAAYLGKARLIDNLQISLSH